MITIERILRPGQVLLVARLPNDEQHAGWAQVMVPAPPQVLLVPWFAVREACQRRGVGTALIREIRALAHQMRRPARTSMFVPGWDGANHLFYVAAGCVYDGDCDEYWITGMPAGGREPEESR